MNAKEKSRAYFNAHGKSRLARGGYWRLDYRHVLAEIETLYKKCIIAIFMFFRLTENMLLDIILSKVSKC